MGTRQQEKSEMTRRELKETATRLFLEKGYEAASIQDIAAAAGYSVGSVYRQWKSKQQLFMNMYPASSVTALFLRRKPRTVIQ